MKMNSFVATTSLLLFGRMAFAILFCFFFLVGLLWKSEIRIENEFLFLFLFLTVFLLTYRILRKTALIKVELYPYNKSEFIFTTKYFLLEKKNKTFSLDQVKDYTYESGNGYQIFTIRFKKSRPVKLLINTDGENIKRFSSSYDDFKKHIKSYNSVNPENTIMARTPIYQRKTGWYFAIVIFLLLIILPVLYLFSDSPVNWPLLLAFYPLAILYLYNFLSKRNKPNDGVL